MRQEIFKVLEPGPYTTIQDSGRFGFQQFGVPPSGALDQFAYLISNILISNPKDAAALEITVYGPTLEVLNKALLSITGADIPLFLNDKQIDHWSSFNVDKGDIIRFGQLKSGCRAYLSVSSGFDVPKVMGSRATYVGAKLGGFFGRPLKKGDILFMRENSYQSLTPKKLKKRFIPEYRKSITLNAIPGPQDDFFDDALEIFFSSEFTISPKADRMGYRLNGPLLNHKEGMPKSIISEPSLPGGVQVTPDGQSLILLTEQTVGGYTKIATIISSDIPFLAQAKPGDKIHFNKIDLQTSHEMLLERQKLLTQIEKNL